jgi:hypothetical protein
VKSGKQVLNQENVNLPKLKGQIQINVGTQAKSTDGSVEQKNAIQISWITSQAVPTDMQQNSRVHWLQFVKVTTYSNSFFNRTLQLADMGTFQKQVDISIRGVKVSLGFKVGEGRLDTVVPNIEGFGFSPYYDYYGTHQFINAQGRGNSVVAMFDQPAIENVGKSWNSYANKYAKIVFDYSTFLVYDAKAYAEITWQAVAVKPFALGGLAVWRAAWAVSYQPITAANFVSFGAAGLDLTQAGVLGNVVPTSNAPGTYLVGYTTDGKTGDPNWFQIADYR